MRGRSWCPPAKESQVGAQNTGANLEPGRTGIAAADFSRIRNADLGRFTVDRLISVLNRLGSRVEVKVRVHRVAAAEQEARVGGQVEVEMVWRCPWLSPGIFTYTTI